MKLNLKSIKTKLLVFMGVLIAVICMGFGAVSYIAASNAMVKSTDEAFKQIALQAAKVVEGRMQGELSGLETVASMENIKNANSPWNNKKVIFDEQAKARGYLRIGLADKNGDLIYNTGATANIKDREYFQKAISGQDAISDPIVAKTDNSLCVMFAVPVKMSDGTTSVIVAVRDGNELSTMTDDITFGKSGSAFMINKSGTTIADKNKDLVIKGENTIENAKKDQGLKSLADIETQMVDGKSGMGEYTYGGKNKFLGYSPVKGTDWSIGIVGDKDDILSSLTPLKTSVAVFSFVFMIIGILLVLIISRSITSSLTAAVKYIGFIADGDLSIEVSPKFLNMKDEIGTLARSVKTMRDSIRDIIQTIKDSSNNIDSQSQSLSAVAEEMSSSSQNVSAAIQEVAKGTGAQSEDLVQITETLNKFAEELGSIAQAIKEIDINAKNVSSTAKGSNGNMQLLAESVNAADKSFKDFMTKISRLGENVIRINEITNLINSIADQTNLLALNAAIEAARAGEAGKGFAVVAEEIRKLSEQTKVSSQNINTLIGDISNDTDTMIETTGVLDEELNNQITSINTVIDSFKQINKEISEIIPKIEAVSINATEVDEGKNSILEKIEGVSSIAEEVSASSEEIAASSEEMSASTEEVASSAQVLADMTKKMMEHVNKFKI